MIPSAILILQPQLHQGLYLTLCSEMLGRSPSRSADTAGLSGLPHLLSTIAAFGGGAETDAYDLLSFGFLIAADERDIPEILEVASGMPFALTDTILRGTQSVIITGTLRHWILAVSKGCRQDQTTTVRTCYDKIYTNFCQQGLSLAFNVTKRDLPDHTFYLTHEKRS